MANGNRAIPDPFVLSLLQDERAGPVLRWVGVAFGGPSPARPAQTPLIATEAKSLSVSAGVDLRHDFLHQPLHVIERLRNRHTTEGRP